MELCFRQRGSTERSTKRPVPIIKAIKRIPVPDFDPNWVPPGALEKLRKEQQPPKEDRPRLELPLYDEPPPGWQPRNETPKEERGVVIQI
ncbi:MAG: hypothetical protein ABH842_03790 [Candidatus Micrarchaeota archaeon]